jgi:hypothetical protein
MTTGNKVTLSLPADAAERLLKSWEDMGFKDQLDACQTVINNLSRA